MVKKTFIAFFVLFLLFSAFAQVDIEEGDISPTDKIIEQTQQNILQSSQISSKIDQLAQSNVDNLQVIAEFLNAKLSEIQTSFTVILILVCLCTLGLWWAIFLYFQSRNLIIFPKKEPKKVVEKPVEEKPVELDKSSKELLSWKISKK